MKQGTPEWFEARRGIPTASEFKRLITGTGKRSDSLNDYAAELAAERMGVTREEFSSQWTERGTELEGKARLHYEFLNDVDVAEAGLVIATSWQGFTFEPAGASPDGFVGDVGLIEIKCLKPSNHIKTVTRDKAPATYFPQCQGQLLCTGRGWVDLYFYHPELPCKAFRIHRDDEYVGKLVAYINEVSARRDEYVEKLKEAA